MALDDLLDEHEQSERVQDWLRRNGAGLIGGVVLGLAAIGGWQWWQREHDARQLAAADQYQQAVDGIAQLKQYEGLIRSVGRQPGCAGDPWRCATGARQARTGAGGLHAGARGHGRRLAAAGHP